MRKFLFQNYRLTLYSYLNRGLRNGSLESIVGFRVVNKAIDRYVCNFGNPVFWRVDRETFIANVGVTLCLDTGKDCREWDGFLSLWFHMVEKVTCSIEYLGAMDELADEELPMLSSCLIPIFSNRQMDSEAEAIWALYLPEALRDPEKRIAVTWAKKMGLTIQYQPVYRHIDTASILFFEEGELMIKDGTAEDASETKPTIVTIPANAIVINTNAMQERYAGFHIYHECVHYEEHYLFYWLQKQIGLSLHMNIR